MNKQIRDDFASYTDYLGLVQNRIPSPPDTETSGNGMLFTAEAIIILTMNGEMTQTLREQYIRAYDKCKLVPGLYSRHPLNHSQESLDDYIGITSASYFLESPVASQVLSYGKSSRYHWGLLKFPYYYENENPYNLKDINAWLGRFPQVITHFKFANREHPNIFSKLYWLFSISTTDFFNKKNPNSYTLPWVMVHTAPEDSIFTKLAKKILMYKVKKNFGSMREVFAQYFQNADHPISKYCLE